MGRADDSTQEREVDDINLYTDLQDNVPVLCLGGEKTIGCNIQPVVVKHVLIFGQFVLHSRSCFTRLCHQTLGYSYLHFRVA
jgi:hypothetical protein